MNELEATDEDLARITRWPLDDFAGLIRFIEPFVSPMGRLSWVGRRLEIATGGWSANEEIVSALQANAVFWALCWTSSARGGLFVFELPEAHNDHVQCDANERGVPPDDAHELWLIWYRDRDHLPEWFSGAGAALSAHNRFRAQLEHWECVLMREVKA